MKFIFALMLFLPCFSFSQDRIIKTNKIEYKVNILKSDSNNIFFKDFENKLDTSIYTFLKSDIAKIYYQNGDSLILKNIDYYQTYNQKSFDKANQDTLYNAYLDGLYNFEPSDEIKGLNFACGMLLPGITFFVPILSKNINKKTKRLRSSNPKMLVDPNYKVEYLKGAKDSKKGEVWISYLKGFALTLSITIIVLVNFL